MAPTVLKVSEVAERLRCGPRSIYRLIENGELRAVRIGRLVRIPESALEDFLADTEEAAPVRTETASVDPIIGEIEGRSYG